MRAQEGNCEIAFLLLLDADEVLHGTSMFLFGCFAFVFLLLGPWSLLLYIGLLLCGFSSLPRKVSNLTKLVGSFAVGTAAFIVPVGSIEYENGLISIEEQVPHGDLLQNWVADIMYDVVAHSWYEVFDNIS
jgi:uncharacterized SAM-binding protein YcdF (DUF218 family)